MISVFQKIFKYLFILLIISGAFQVYASTTNGTIDTTNHSALLCMDDTCATTTEINFLTTNGRDVHVTSSAVTGDIWSEEMGWINLDPTNGGVTNTNNGELGGYAWGENAGWINFSPTNGGVNISSSGKFIGWAWAQNYGWIKFNCSTPNACVETDWRYPGGGGGGSTGGGGGLEGVPGVDICPNITGEQTLIPTGLVINGAGNCVSPEQCNVIDGALKQPLDVVIIIDRSGSMAGAKMTQAKNAAVSFIDNLVPGSDRVSYVNYSNTASLVNNLSSSFLSTKTKIQATTVNGATNIGAAVKIAYQEIYNNGRDGVKHVIILLTDGEANISDVSTLTPNQYAISRSNIAKLDGTIIYSIGLGTSVSENLLKSVATLPSYFYHSPTGNDLSNIYLQIAAIECTAAPSKVFDMVVYDQNSNKVRDNNENGLAGAEVSLISSNGGQPVRTLTTSQTGNFIFETVAPGPYSVCNNPPEGMYQTSPVSNACYNINVIQGINTTGLPFMVAGITPDFCTTNPTDPSCITPTFCEIHPTDPSCIIEDFCTTHPTDPSCITPTFCEIHPTDPSCENLPFCTLYPLDSSCITTPPAPPTDPTDPVNPPGDSVGDTIANIIGSLLGDSDSVGLFDSLKNGLVSVIETIYGDLFNAVNKTIAIFKDPIGNAITKIVSTTGAATGLYFGVVNVAFTGPISLSEIFLTPLRLWSLILIALGIRKRKSPWGTVYDSVTKQPLDPAYVVLQDLQGNEVATSITDLDGRYGFLVPAGQYRLVANKTNYEFPSKKLYGKNNDELYQELYFSEIIEIKSDGEVITKNIPMDPIKFDWNEFAKKDQNLMKFFSRRELWTSRVSNLLFYLGFIITIISTLITPIIYNLIILGLYLLMFILRKTILKPRAFGHINNRETENPLSFAVIRVFFAGGEHEVIHKVADKTGKYYCLIPNGTYYTKIENKNSDESYSLVHTSDPIEVKNGYLNKKFKV